MRDLNLALDSGAHSLYNKKFAGISGKKGTVSRLYSSYDFYKSVEFKKYLDQYIKFLHTYKECYKFYVNLDIIFEPKLTWEMQKYLESCGLAPMPVYHYGEDITWLTKYIDNYGYIAIGGLGQDITKQKFVRFGDKVFSYIKKSDGSPRVKVHGLAMAGIPLLKRYPWYSIDASTWSVFARNGAICLPGVANLTEKDNYVYFKPPFIVSVTPRTTQNAIHYNNLSPIVKKVVDRYLKKNGFSIDDLRESYTNRDILNIRFFSKVQESLKIWYNENFNFEKGGNIYIAGMASGAGSNLEKHKDLLNGLNGVQINWLGSYYYKAHAELLLNLQKLNNKRVRPRLFPKTRPRL